MNDNGMPLIPDNNSPPLVGHERGRTNVPCVIQPAGRTRAFAAGAERGKMRACDADRDHVVEFLNMAYT
jgi:hypothetical protein